MSERTKMDYSISFKILVSFMLLLWSTLMYVSYVNQPEPKVVYKTPVKTHAVVEIEIADIKPLNVISSIKSEDVVNKFNSLRYDLNDYIVPRVIVATLPTDLNKLSIPEKKELFVKIVLPLILHENESINHERNLAIFNINRDTEGSRLIMAYLYKKYRISTNSATNPIIKTDEELLTKIMPIPVSLVLAQTAIESGWGTSYFARHGNALFGQHAYKRQKSLKPRNIVAPRVAAFKTLGVSVSAYMRNLNTHLAYSDFRKKRMNLSNFKGVILAEHLDLYSERGAAYIKDVKQMIKYNKFDRFERHVLEDDTYRAKKSLDMISVP